MKAVSSKRSASPQLPTEQTQKEKEDVIPGKPLDFSNMEISSLDALIKLVPRSGKRKEIPKEDKKGFKAGDDAGIVQENGQEEEKEKKKEDLFKPPPAETKIKALAKVSNIPITGIKAIGGKKQEESKGVKKKKIINRECNSLLLFGNALESMRGMKEILNIVMFNSENLQWLDLSFNKITIIDLDILNFVRLKTLYLHCNEIISLREVRKLARLPDLRSVKLYGNKVAKVPHYRSYVIAVLPQIFRLDSVMITKKEITNAIVVTEYFREKNICMMPYDKLQHRWEDKQKTRKGEASEYLKSVMKTSMKMG